MKPSRHEVFNDIAVCIVKALLLCIFVPLGCFLLFVLFLVESFLDSAMGKRVYRFWFERREA